MPAVSFTIAEFCEAHRISESTFFKLMREGTGPATIKIGRSRRIPADAADAWLRAIAQAQASDLGDREAKS